MRNALGWLTGVERRSVLSKAGSATAELFIGARFNPARDPLTDNTRQPLIRANLAGAGVVHRQRGRSLRRSVERLPRRAGPKQKIDDAVTVMTSDSL